MRNCICLFLLLLSAAPLVNAAPKVHIIIVGKSMKVKWMVGPDESETVTLTVRPLLVDGHLREYVLGAFHEVTERMFVARRVFRINDNLPQENPSVPHWVWQRGAWILIDRLTGHITPINLAGFDPYYSVGEWYRGYFAYCAVSDDGKQTFAVVAELGRRKPILRQPLGKLNADGAQVQMPDSGCAVPVWQRQPARVTFKTATEQKLSFTLRGEIAGEISAESGNDDDDAN